MTSLLIDVPSKWHLYISSNRHLCSFISFLIHICSLWLLIGISCLHTVRNSEVSSKLPLTSRATCKCANHCMLAEWNLKICKQHAHKMDQWTTPHPQTLPQFLRSVQFFMRKNGTWENCCENVVSSHGPRSKFSKRCLPSLRRVMSLPSW